MDRVYRFNWNIDDFSVSAFEDALKNFHAKDGFMYWRISDEEPEGKPLCILWGAVSKNPVNQRGVMGIGKVISERPEYFSSTAPSYLYSLSEYENRYYAQVHFDIVSFYKPLFSADYLRAKFRRLNYFSGYGGSSGYISRTINEEVRKLITNKILSL